MAETIVKQSNLERCRLTSKDIRMMASFSCILNDEALEFGRSIIASRVTEIILQRAVKEIVGGEILDINVPNLKKRFIKDEFLSNMMRNTTNSVLAVSLLETSKYSVHAKDSYKRGCEVYGVETMSQEEIRTLAHDASAIVDFNIEAMLKNVRSKMMSIVNSNKEELKIAKAIEELSVSNREIEPSIENYYESFLIVAGEIHPDAKRTIAKKGEYIFKSDKRSLVWKIHWMNDIIARIIKHFKLLSYLTIVQNERKWMGIKVSESRYLDTIADLTRCHKDSFLDSKISDKFVDNLLGKTRIKCSQLRLKLQAEFIVLAEKLEKESKA